VKQILRTLLSVFVKNKVAYLRFQKGRGQGAKKVGCGQGCPLLTEGMTPPHWEEVWGGGLALTIFP